MKGYQFEVPLPPGPAVAGAVLADRVESIDRHARRIEVAGQAPDAVVAEVTERIVALLGG